MIVDGSLLFCCTSARQTPREGGADSGDKMTVGV
jgi:hypothetical protein